MHHLFSVSMKQMSQHMAQNMFIILKQNMSSRSNAVAVERHSTAVCWFGHTEMSTTAVVALLLDSG